MGEEIGSHLRESEQGNDEHNAYHPQASHDGEGDEHHQYIFEKHDGNTLRTGILPVESDVDNRIQKTREESDKQDGPPHQHPNVCQCDGQDIAEKESGQVGCKSGRKKTEDNPDGHAECPKHGDGGIFTHILPLAEPFHSESREHGKDGCRQKWRNAGVEPDANTAERLASDGDKPASLILKAMSYNIAKEIAAVSIALEGVIDGIILTGAIAYNQLITEQIFNYVRHISPVTIYPGENEMLALAENALEILKGEYACLTYQ